MTFALNTTELTGSDVTVGDCKISYASIVSMTDAERAAYGIQTVVDDAIPEGKVASGSTIVLVNGVPTRQWTLVDAPPPPVPSQVTPVQGRLALDAAGKLDAVKAMVAAADQPTQIWFEYATIWERDNPILISMGTALGMTGADIDALFVSAVA